jgi:hypothetical protein
MKLWWDKGILWVLLEDGQVLSMNSYVAQELLALLFREKGAIDAQAKLDEFEFGRDG